MKIRIASRRSKLSIKQVELTIDALRKVYPSIETEIKFYKTKGDIYKNLLPTEIGVKGIFEKEVNKAVLSGEADIAVHSLKDVPSVISKDLILVAVLPRDNPLEALVSRDGSKLNELKTGSVIGTSSIRRRAALLNLRKDIIIKPLRGNVDTRIKKLQKGEYDAIVVAEAGLKRLGLDKTISRQIFKPEEVTPAPGQGIIGIYARSDNDEVIKIFNKINDQNTFKEAYVEREIMKRVGGGCNVPLGVYAENINGFIRVVASLYSPDGDDKIIVIDKDYIANLDNLIKKVSNKLVDKGKRILDMINM